MKNKIDHKTLLNFSEGKYSYKDYLKVKNWFNTVEEHSEVKDELFAQWNELLDSGSKQENDLTHIFEKIQSNILLEEKKQTKRLSIWQYYNQVAAILLIPVLAFSIWYYISSNNISDNIVQEGSAPTWVEINAPDGARVEFSLPDGSMGWLNSGSKLKYPAVFDEIRKVELLGEAWFNVKHCNDSEFEVSVTGMNIKVLGTQFNVSAYHEDGCSDVTLEKGKVEVEGSTGVFQQILKPGEKLSFNRDSRSVKLLEVDASRFSAWKDGYLVIDNEPLGEVVGRLERWYNVDINIEDDELGKYRFKATFKDEPLEEVLKLIAKTTPITYNVEKRVADNNGVLKKKTITIKLK